MKLTLRLQVAVLVACLFSVNGVCCVSRTPLSDEMAMSRRADGGRHTAHSSGDRDGEFDPHDGGDFLYRGDFHDRGDVEAPRAGDTTVASCTANSPPIAQISGPRVTEVGTLLFYGAAASSDADQSDGSLLAAWVFRTGTGFGPDAAVTGSVEYTPLIAGEITVGLRVTDHCGATSYLTQQLFVAEVGGLLEPTTTVDEEDSVTDPATPLGAGFSLREAIRYAANNPGPFVISPSPLLGTAPVFEILSALPPLTGPDSIVLVGAEGAVIDGVTNTLNCIQMTSNNHGIHYFEITRCGNWSILNSGDGNTISRCKIHAGASGVLLNGDFNTFGPGNVIYDMGGIMVQIAGQNTVTGNVLHHGTLGIFASNGSSASQLDRNIIHTMSNAGVQVRNGSDDLIVWHNTIDNSGGSGLLLDSNGTGMDIRGNIFSGSGSYGIEGSTSGVALLENNLYWNNTVGDCGACTMGTGFVQLDPAYEDPTVGDYSFTSNSPAAEAGPLVGIDLNGAAPGLFSGAAPDIGAVESIAEP